MMLILVDDFLNASDVKNKITPKIIHLNMSDLNKTTYFNNRVG